MYKIFNPRVDLHNHFWAENSDRPKSIFLEILSQMKRTVLDICALTGDKDDRYEKVVWEEKPKGLLIEYFENCIIVGGKKVIMRGEEVYTDKGSIVIAGAKRKLGKPGKPLNLEEALCLGLAHGAFVILPHPFLKFGGLRQNLEIAWQYADAVEISPFCNQKKNAKAEKFAEEHGLPAICCSDARHPTETGRGFFKINENLVFEDGTQIVQKLREAVKKTIINYGRPANWFEIARYLIKSVVG